MSDEEERLKLQKEAQEEKALRVPFEDSLEPNLASSIGAPPTVEEWNTVQTTFFQPNIGFILGVTGCLLGLFVLLMGVLLGTPNSGSAAESGMSHVVHSALSILISSLFILLVSLRKEPKLQVSSSSLKIIRDDGEEIIPLTDVVGVEIKSDFRLRMKLKGGRDLTLPGLSRTMGVPVPCESVVCWFRNHGVPVKVLNVPGKRLIDRRISLPELHGAMKWHKWGLAVVVPLMVATMAFFGLLMTSSQWQENMATSQRAIIFFYFLLIPYLAFILAPIARRWFSSKSSLEFTDVGVLVSTKGRHEPEIDPASFRRFIIEFRREWWGITRKRLCAETHYGRRIPLTQFALKWQLEAEQILHQAGEKGIPVVLRKEGDEEPLEIP